MLIKRRDGSAGRARLQGVAAGLASGVLDRRTFLQRSGLAAGAGAALGLMPLGSVRKAQAGPKIVGAPTEIKKNICTHCSVGCTVIAEVQNGVWVGQEPAWDSPINRGSHCAKGASVRELVHGDRRRLFMMGGSAVAAAAVVPLTGSEAVADESQAERVKARYKETDHVKNYYRVNRY